MFQKIKHKTLNINSCGNANKYITKIKANIIPSIIFFN